MESDPRFIPREKQPGAPVDLFSEDGFPMHAFRIKGTNKALETGYLNRGEWKLKASEEPPDVVIEHAMEDGALKHFNDGRDGGIWVVAANREDIAVGLLELPSSEWQFLGIGIEQSERCMFMLHATGSGRSAPPRQTGNGRSQQSDPGPSRTFSLKSLKSRVKEVKDAVTEGNKKESLFKKITRKVKEALE